MAWQFTCPLCKKNLIVLKTDMNKQAHCPECKAWVPIPTELIESDETPNCRIRSSASNSNENSHINPEYGSVSSERIEVQASIDELQNQEKAEDIENKKQRLEQLLKENPHLKLTAKPMSFQQILKNIPRVIPVTAALILINLVVFIVLSFLGVNPIEPTGLSLTEYGGNSAIYVLFNNKFYRLLTSMFIHGGIIHLVFNLWILWILGNMAERFFGSISFGIIYIISGLAASMASLFFIGSFDSVSCGASGAIFGIAGALLALFLLGKSIIPPVVRRSMSTRLLLLIGANLLMGFTLAHIDNAAHIGGLLIGFALGAIMMRPLAQVKNPLPIKSLAGALGILAALGIIFTLILPVTRNNILDSSQLINPLTQENASIDSENEKSIRDLKTLYIKLDIYRRMGDDQKVSQTIEKIQQLNPEDTNMMFFDAYLNQKDDNIDEAVEIYENIIQKQPENDTAIGNLAWMYYLKNDFEKTIEYSQQAYEINPNAYFARFNEALALLRLNRLEESRKKYTKTLEMIAENDSDAAYARSGAIGDLNDLREQGIQTEEVQSILKEIFKLQYTDY